MATVTATNAPMLGALTDIKGFTATKAVEMIDKQQDRGSGSKIIYIRSTIKQQQLHKKRVDYGSAPDRALIAIDCAKLQKIN